MMRKRLLAGVAVVTLFSWSGAQADLPVIDATSLGQLVHQVYNSAQQLQTEIATLQQMVSFYTNAVQNTVSLPVNIYHDLTGEVQQIEALGQQAQMLVGNTKNMLDNLGNAGGYPSGNLADLQFQLNAEQNAISTAMRQAGQVLNLLPTQLQTNSQNLADLNSQAQAAGGRQATLQTLASIEAANGQNINNMNATNATTMQALLTYYIAQADRQAAIDATNRQDMQKALANDCAALSSNGGGTPWFCNAAAQTSPGTPGTGGDGSGMTVVAYGGN